MIQQFNFTNTEIEGLVHIKPFIAFDNRGHFIKDYSKEVFKLNNLDYNLEEVFYTISFKGVVRAIHFQREKQQAKLVRCVKGKIYDVVVDLRKNSPTFGKYEAFVLSDDNNEQLLVPEGCGHGYLVLEDSVVSYKCAEKFYGDLDDGVLWNDEDLNIEWPIEQVDQIILSDKDKNLQSFSTFMKKYGGF